MKIKTLDIIALEWFDRINGNSYFAATICINYQLKGELQLKLPFQYGYGDQYKSATIDELEKQKIIKDRTHYQNGSSEGLWNYCDRKKIIVRYTKHENCKKAELKNI